MAKQRRRFSVEQKLQLIQEADWRRPRKANTFFCWAIRAQLP